MLARLKTRHLHLGRWSVIMIHQNFFSSLPVNWERYCGFLQGLEFKVALHLEWLTLKAREAQSTLLFNP